jgi:UDP-N-acetylglucosamine kinase
MDQTEIEIVEKAAALVIKNSTTISRRLTDKSIYLPEEHPVSVFMSASPGAEKTEVSKAFISKYGENTIRLDPDELRSEFEDYNGSNSYLFQTGVSLPVERTLDRLFKNSQSFVLDGTFSSFGMAICSSQSENWRPTHSATNFCRPVY